MRRHPEAVGAGFLLGACVECLAYDSEVGKQTVPVVWLFLIVSVFCVALLIVEHFIEGP